MTPAAVRRRASAALLAASWLAASSPATAQRYHVHTYTETDGLPSSTVYGMEQTPDGRVWFATRSGIAAYDGVDWETYDVSDGLPAKVVFHLALDSADRLWSVGAPGAEHVAYLDGGKWVACPGPEGAGHGANAVAASAGSGPPWLAVAQSDGPVMVFSGSEWKTITSPGDAWSIAYALAPAGDRLLLGTGRGLWSAEPLSGKPPEFVEAAGPDSVIGLAADPAGGVWVFRRDRIGLLRDGAWSVVVPWTCPGRELVVRAAADGRGGVFFGLTHHVFSYHPAEGIESLDHTNGLVSDGMSGVLVDREGRPWIACGRGVSCLVDRVFASYTRVQGLLDDEVTAILRRSDGMVLLGQPGGVTFFTDRPATRVPFGDPTIRVLDMTEDEHGAVWAATGTETLYRIGRDGALSRRGSSDGLPAVTAAVHRFSDGEIWAAGEGFVGRLRGSRFEPLDVPSAMLDNYPRRFLETSGGDRYLATSRGVLRLRAGEGWTMLVTAADTRSVYSLQERADGSLWWGCGTGLFRLEGDALVRETAPSVDRPVYFLHDDRDGNTWIGTDNGVIVWDGAAPRHLSVREGLAGRETNRSACLLDPAGRMWVGTDGGLSIYRPGFRLENRVDPVVTLLPPIVHGEPLTPDAEGRLVTDDPRLTFPFRAVLFGQGGELPVRSRLRGLESEWSEPRPARLRPLRYAKLPPGVYTMEVQALGPNGWSAPVVGDPVAVQGPLWRRTWFLAILGAVGILSAAAFVIAAVQSRYARALQQDVHARTEELEAQRERLSVTLGGIADGVIATNLSGEITLMNAAAQRITAWPLDEARGRRASEVLVLDGDRVDLDTDQGVSSSLRLRRYDGTTCSVEVSLAAVRQGGRRTGSVFVFRDVTERLRAEEELIRSQKLEAVGLLAGGIAHDFNNLLMVILGQLSLLESGEGVSDETRRQATEARTAAQRARSLTRQLLTFAKGGLPVRTPQPIGHVLREAAQFAALGGAATCRFDIPDDLALVEIDADQMGQVIGNLVINARQAMPGGGTIHIRARNLEPAPQPLTAARAVRIEVEDEGPGVAPDVLSRLFEPYFSTKSEGSGLGLATSHSIVRKHDGHLSVESPPGKGAIFRIDLPASERPAARSRGAKEDVAAGKGRVLVMDDDEPVRRAIEGMLRHLGYDVVGKSEGRAAVDGYRDAAAAGTPFDVVLLDLTVAGGLGGREAAAGIRGLDPAACMVASSGYSSDPALADPARFGFRAALEKPFLVEDLARVLREVLGANGTS